MIALPTFKFEVPRSNNHDLKMEEKFTVRTLVGRSPYIGVDGVWIVDGGIQMYLKVNKAFQKVVCLNSVTDEVEIKGGIWEEMGKPLCISTGYCVVCFRIGNKHVVSPTLKVVPSPVNLRGIELLNMLVGVNKKKDLRTYATSLVEFVQKNNSLEFNNLSEEIVKEVESAENLFYIV